MKRINNNSQGGALLFAIITALVICFIGTTLVLFTTNKYKIICNEIKRKEAYYWLRAGMEYANYMIRTGNWKMVENAEGKLVVDEAGNKVENILLPDPESKQIKITVVPADLSDYKIEVLTSY